MLLFLLSYLLADAASLPAVVLLLFVCSLNLTLMEDELLEALESVANEPVNLKHHAAYIRLALQMQDDGEMAADAQSQMVNAVPATDGKSYVLGAYQSPSNNIPHL